MPYFMTYTSMFDVIVHTFAVNYWQLLELGVLPRLIQMARSSSAEEAVKALYALSAVIRNHPLGQEHFYLHKGASLLEVCSTSHPQVTYMYRIGNESSISCIAALA